MHYSFLELYNSLGEQNFNSTGCKMKPERYAGKRQPV